ncbi:MAG: CHRD domain-containing protein, partial [Bryobacteraceae bacterium]
FDLSYRFPGRVEFNGFHIHNGTAAETGPVTVNSGLAGNASVVSADGFGNVSRRFNVLSPGGLATLNSLLANPERHYLNLHSTVHPAGIVRTQLGGAPGTPAVSAVLSAVLDEGRTVTAPGGLVAIFGSNLARLATDLSGWLGDTVPAALNGVEVSIGGRPAPLLYVGPGQINAQVPVDVAAGTRALTVKVGSATSAAFNLTVADTAPTLFYIGGAAILKENGTLVSGPNPAAAGDTLRAYGTGCGATTPALATGQIVGATGRPSTAAATATIDGRDAQVLSSLAAPGYPGVCEVTLRVPASVRSGFVGLAIRIGQATSNILDLAVR